MRIENVKKKRKKKKIVKMASTMSAAELRRQKILRNSASRMEKIVGKGHFASMEEESNIKIQSMCIQIEKFFVLFYIPFYKIFLSSFHLSSFALNLCMH